MEFTHEKFGKLRVVMKDGTPWFVACDVAKSLGIKNTTNVLVQRVNGKDRIHLNEFGMYFVNCINENGLRNMVFRTNKHVRDEYAAWIRNEVLPKVTAANGVTKCDAMVVARNEKTTASRSDSHYDDGQMTTLSEMPDLFAPKSVASIFDTITKAKDVLSGVNNETVSFDHPKFGTIRVLVENGKPLACGFDVAKALGYTKPRNAIEMHCRCALKRGVPHPQSPSKQIEMTFIPEGDIYRLIVHSKLPSAEQFEHWLFDEMLPTLSRTGNYVIKTNENDIVGLLRKTADIIEDQRSKLAEQNQQMDVLRAQIAKKRFIDDHHEDLTRFINKCVRSYGSSIYGKSNIALGWLDFYRNLMTELGEDVRKRGTPGIHFIEDYEMPMALRVAKNLVLDNYVNLFDIDTIDLIEGVVA